MSMVCTYLEDIIPTGLTGLKGLQIFPQLFHACCGYCLATIDGKVDWYRWTY